MKSIYDHGQFVAHTSRYSSRMRQIASQVTLETPDAYPEKRTEEIVALWDTGASGSVISYSIAEKLGLQPSGMEKTCGVGGIRDCEVYDVVLHLNPYFRDIKLKVTSGKLHKDDGGPERSEIGFLIGMDLIGYGDFFTGCYRDGGETRTMFSYRAPTAHSPVDYLKEIELYNRDKQQKQRAAESRRKYSRNTGKRKKKR